MSTFDEQKSEQNSKVERVRQAAHSLGISERTVYRRLRSGKLEQLPSESRRADSVMSTVNFESIEAVIQDKIPLLLDKMVCQNDMTLGKLETIRQDMANKDEQIRALLENQKELTLTIQKLQAQIFELARLALQQPVRAEEKPDEGSIAVQLPPESHRRGLWDWLRTLRGRDRG